MKIKIIKDIFVASGTISHEATTDAEAIEYKRPEVSLSAGSVVHRIDDPDNPDKVHILIPETGDQILLEDNEWEEHNDE